MYVFFLRAAFAKESEVLTGNLGDKLISQNEILRDVSDLKALANLQESMEWLAVCLRGFFSSLPQSSSKCKNLTLYNMIQSNIKTIQSFMIRLNLMLFSIIQIHIKLLSIVLYQ